MIMGTRKLKNEAVGMNLKQIQKDIFKKKMLIVKMMKQNYKYCRCIQKNVKS